MSKGSSAVESRQNNLYKLQSSPQGYKGPRGDELDIEEEIDDKIYVEEEHNFVHRKNKKYPFLILHINGKSTGRESVSESKTQKDNPQETFSEDMNTDVDSRIDQMLKEADIDGMSETESDDSEFAEEAENIEIREKIEEMKRIVSVATLFQEKVMLIDRLHEFAKEIGTKRTIENILGFIIPEVIRKEKPNVKRAIIPQFLKLSKFLVNSKEGYNAVVKDLIIHYT